MNDPDLRLLLAIVLAVGLAGALWYFRDDIFAPDDEPVVAQPESVAEEGPAQTGPMHPLAAGRSQSQSQSGPLDAELVPLPPLDDSDSYFVLALIDSFGPGLEPVLANEALIDKFVATVDNLTRNHVAEKIRPVGGLAGAFAADAAGENGEFYLTPGNYERYDLLVGLVTGADPEDVAAMYRRFYPLFQESYERLGYPGGYFNDRVVEVIDHLLETPEPDGPIRLVRPHVLYEFADAELEALSSGQKLLLRMGGEHAAEIKRVLQDMRALIAQSPTQPPG